MAEQLDEIPEWKVSEQFLEEKLRKKNSAQDIGQNGEDLSDGLLSEDVETEEEVPGNYLPGEMRTPDNGEEPVSNTLGIPEEMDIEDLMEEVHSDSKVSTSLAMPDVPERTDWNTLSIFPDGSPGSVDGTDDEYELSSLLERLDLTENIRRMNESAQEDIADVIECESEPVELSAAVPAIVEDAIDMETDSSGGEILQPVEENSRQTVPEFETAEEPESGLDDPEADRAEELETEELEFDTELESVTEPVNRQEEELEFDIDDIDTGDESIGIESIREPETEPMTEQTDTTGVPEASEKENSQETMPEFETADEPELVANERTDEPVSEPEEELKSDDEIEPVTEPEKLPKYKKPEFSLELAGPDHKAEEERVEISEYDMVPTIDGLEKKWKKDGSDLRMQGHVPSEPVYVAEDAVQPAAKENEDEHSNGFAYSLADIMPASTATAPEISDAEAEPEVPPAPKKTVSFDVQPERHAVHTEEIIKKSGGARRAYHRIIL